MVSPELVLIDPELRAWALARLPERDPAGFRSRDPAPVTLTPAAPAVATPIAEHAAQPACAPEFADIIGRERWGLPKAIAAYSFIRIGEIAFFGAKLIAAVVVLASVADVVPHG